MKKPRIKKLFICFAHANDKNQCFVSAYDFIKNYELEQNQENDDFYLEFQLQQQDDPSSERDDFSLERKYQEKERIRQLALQSKGSDFIFNNKNSYYSEYQQLKRYNNARKAIILSSIGRILQLGTAVAIFFLAPSAIASNYLQKRKISLNMQPTASVVPETGWVPLESYKLSFKPLDPQKIPEVVSISAGGFSGVSLTTQPGGVSGQELNSGAPDQKQKAAPSRVVTSMVHPLMGDGGAFRSGRLSPKLTISQSSAKSTTKVQNVQLWELGFNDKATSNFSFP